MTKLTIVTNSRGKLIGAVQGHELSEKTGDIEVSVSFAPGHKLHKVDVDVDMTNIDDPKEFERVLARHVPKPAPKKKTKSSKKKS
jgi:hypothetical protein